MPLFADGRPHELTLADVDEAHRLRRAACAHPVVRALRAARRAARWPNGTAVTSSNGSSNGGCVKYFLRKGVGGNRMRNAVAWWQHALCLDGLARQLVPSPATADVVFEGQTNAFFGIDPPAERSVCSTR